MAGTLGIVSITVQNATAGWTLTVQLTQPPTVALTPAQVLVQTLEGVDDPSVVVSGVTPTTGAPASVDVSLVASNPLPPPPLGADPPAHLLVLTNVANLDPDASWSGFVLKPSAPVDPCAPAADTPRPTWGPGPAIDYTAREYLALRAEMLGRLTGLGATQPDPPAPDLLRTLVEALAYQGDQLSYHQDAIATEAYLGTARLRRSVRRHAVLMDHRVAPGCNARVFAVVAVDGPVHLPVGSHLLTRLTGTTRPVLPWTALKAARKAGAHLFLTLEAVDLDPSLNALELADSVVELQAGATEALLSGVVDATAGTVLVLEEVASPLTGLSADADAAHRQAVRLLAVEHLPAGSPTQTRITWHPDDALRTPFFVQATVGGVAMSGLAMFRGNAVLADHGWVSQGAPSPPTVPYNTPYRPTIDAHDLVWCAPADPTASARRSLTQSDASLRASMHLDDSSGAEWRPVPDLLASGPFARHFSAEHSERRIALRFGDGTLGLRPAPGLDVVATYRTGNGPRGNIGSELLTHLVAPEGSPVTSWPIAAITNPLPASGGRAAPSLATAKEATVAAFRTPLRGITPEDWVWLAEQDDQVLAANATVLTPTPGTTQATVTLQRRWGRAAGPHFLAAQQERLAAYRPAGVGLDVAGATPTPVGIRLVARLDGSIPASRVRASLARVFSAGRSDGVVGYFAPDQRLLGQPVYLSDIVHLALTVPGVQWIDTSLRSDPRIRFAEVGAPLADTRTNLAQGILPMAAGEVATAASDPTQPAAGWVQWLLVSP